MATHGDIGVSQPAASTITMKVRTVTLDLNSTVTHQEVLTLGDAESTLGLARIVASAPASTMYGLVTRPIGPVTITQSTATDLLARVDQGIGNSSAADRWQVTAANSSAADFTPVRIVDSSGTGYHGPTKPMPVTVTDSSNAVVKPGDSDNNAIRVNVVAGAAAGSTVVTVSTGSVRVHQSTATDLLARVNQGVGNSSAADRWRVNAANSSAGDYTPVRLVDSSGTGFLTPGVDYSDGSTTSTLVGPGLAYGNSSNDTMRLVKTTQPLPVQLRTGTLTLNSTTAVITSTHSTAVYALVSSAASVRQKVYAYIVTSTHTTPSTLVFMSSAGSDLYHVGFGSGSSGMTGANLAVTPPAYLFATAANEALNVRIEGGGSTAASTAIARISFSYVSEA